MTTYAFARFFAAGVLVAIAGVAVAVWVGQTWDVVASWCVVGALCALVSREGARLTRRSKDRVRARRRRERALNAASGTVVRLPVVPLYPERPAVEFTAATQNFARSMRYATRSMGRFGQAMRLKVKP